MKQKMIQQKITQPYTLEFEEIEIPKLEADQVLIQMKRIGICGSDIHTYHGKHPYVKYPVVQGHEVSGKIIALGENVHHLNLNQKVTLEPQIFCGQCYPCTHGKYNLCESLKVIGFQALGAASEYFAVAAEKVTPLPDVVSYDEGAMIEPLAVAMHACRRSGEVQGQKALILGAGPIGILLCQSLKALGAEKVMITDVSEYRLKVALQCGADYTLNTSHTTPAEFNQKILEYFGTDKADIIYDCAGNDTTMEQAIQNARKGSVIMLIAVYDKKANIDLAKLNDSELDLKTSMMYRHEDFVEAIEMVANQKIRLQPLMSKSFPLLEFQKAYAYIDKNRETTMKVLICVDAEE